MDSKPCLRRGVAALLRRDVHDDLRDEATRWIVLSRVAALCAREKHGTLRAARLYEIIRRW